MAQEEIFPSRRREKSYFMALAGKEFKMKKSRRMIALILVFAFVFAFMVMSVSAATTVMPRATCTKLASCRFEEYLSWICEIVLLPSLHFMVSISSIPSRVKIVSVPEDKIKLHE